MADLIDRDAAIARIDCCLGNSLGGRKEFDSGLMQARKFVISTPAVNRWIPCEDELPENKIGVIFTVDRGHPFVCVGYRINTEREGLKLRRWFDNLSGLNFSDYDVKAWMPMPSAYEPPEKE